MKEKIGTIIGYIVFVSFLMIGAFLFFANTAGHGFVSEAPFGMEIISIIIAIIVFVFIFIYLRRTKENYEIKNKTWHAIGKFIVALLISLWIALLAWGIIRQLPDLPF